MAGSVESGSITKPEEAERSSFALPQRKSGADLYGRYQYLDDMISFPDMIVSLLRGEVLYCFPKAASSKHKIGLRKNSTTGELSMGMRKGDLASNSQQLRRMLALIGAPADITSEADATHRAQWVANDSVLLGHAYVKQTSIPKRTLADGTTMTFPTHTNWDAGYVSRLLSRFNHLESNAKKMAMEAKEEYDTALSRFHRQTGVQLAIELQNKTTKAENELLDKALEDLANFQSNTPNVRLSCNYSVVLFMDDAQRHARTVVDESVNMPVSVGALPDASHYGFDIYNAEHSAAWSEIQAQHFRNGSAIRVPFTTLQSLNAKRGEPTLRKPVKDIGGQNLLAFAEIWLTMLAAHAGIGMAVLGAQIVGARGHEQRRAMQRDKLHPLLPQTLVTHAAAADRTPLQQIDAIFWMERGTQSVRDVLLAAEDAYTQAVKATDNKSKVVEQSQLLRDADALTNFFADNIYPDGVGKEWRRLAKRLGREILSRQAAVVNSLEIMTDEQRKVRLDVVTNKFEDSHALLGVRVAQLLYEASLAGFLMLDATPNNIVLRAIHPKEQRTSSRVDDVEPRLVDLDPQSTFCLRGVRPSYLFIIMGTMFYFQTLCDVERRTIARPDTRSPRSIVDYFLKPLRSTILTVARANKMYEQRHGHSGVDEFMRVFAAMADPAQVHQSALGVMNELAYYTQTPPFAEIEKRDQELVKAVAVRWQHYVDFYVLRELDDQAKQFEYLPETQRTDYKNVAESARRGRCWLKPFHEYLKDPKDLTRDEGSRNITITNSSKLDALLRLMNDMEMATDSQEWPSNTSAHDYKLNLQTNGKLEDQALLSLLQDPRPTLALEARTAHVKGQRESLASGEDMQPETSDFTSVIARLCKEAGTSDDGSPVPLVLDEEALRMNRAPTATDLSLFSSQPDDAASTTANDASSSADVSWLREELA